MRDKLKSYKKTADAVYGTCDNSQPNNWVISIDPATADCQYYGHQRTVLRKPAIRRSFFGARERGKKIPDSKLVLGVSTATTVDCNTNVSSHMGNPV